MPTRFAAHRGGAALWPENSLLAFRNALAMGAPLLELDVHLTSDGNAAVIHDSTLDRTTNGSGPVAARTAEELRRVRIKARDGALVDEGVPMLADVLALAAPTPAAVLVEVKTPGPAVTIGPDGLAPGPRYPGLERRVIDELTRARMAERAMVMAFNPGVLAEVRAIAPAQRTVLLVDRHAGQAQIPPDAIVLWGTEIGASFLGVHHSLCNAALVSGARRAGLGIGVFTVNDESTMRKLLDLGVDVIISDRPDLVAKAQQER
jgi:glycerophosphoryl diester phosphodiesterase